MGSEGDSMGGDREYDVALSFASEDRKYVDQVANLVSVRYTPSSGIRMPVPWQQVIDLLVGMTPNSQQDIGEIGLRVDLVGQAG